MSARLVTHGLAVLWMCAVSCSADASEPVASARSRAAVDRVRPMLSAALAQQGLVWGSPVFLRIFKEERQLEVWVASTDRFEHFETLSVCAASGTLGPKQARGDLQAPEGFYAVGPGAMNPFSSYHLSFDLGYPNAYDRAHGRTGSALMVHGRCVSAGCFAMTDPGIERIYALVEAALAAGQPYVRVHVFPFRMHEARMAAAATSPWAPFWANLAEGYRHFEEHRRPPDTRVSGGRYVFRATPPP